MRVFYEPQIYRADGRFWLTVTISRSDGDDRWTSLPATLQAGDWDGAKRKAAEQLTALRQVLEGGNDEGEDIRGRGRRAEHVR